MSRNKEIEIITKLFGLASRLAISDKQRLDCDWFPLTNNVGNALTEIDEVTAR